MYRRAEMIEIEMLRASQRGNVLTCMIPYCKALRYQRKNSLAGQRLDFAASQKTAQVRLKVDLGQRLGLIARLWETENV